MKAWKLLLVGLLLAIGAAPMAGNDVLTMRILYNPTPFNVPAMVLRDQGLLAQELRSLGWKLEWVTKPMTEPLTAQALATRTLDMAAVSDCAMVIARACGNDMVIYEPCSVAPKAYAVVVPIKSSASNLKALAGKRIGLPIGTAAHYLLARSLVTEGLTLSKVTVVDMTYAEALAALSRNGLDAAVLAEPYLSKALVGGKVRLLPGKEGLIPGLAVTVVRRQFLDNETAMDHFREVMDRTRKYVAGNPSAVAKLVARETGLPLDTARAVLAKHRFTGLSSAQMLSDLTATADFLFGQRMIARQLTVKDLVGCNCN